MEIFAYHGKDDEVAFYGYSAKTYENLKASGFTKLNFQTEEGLGHSVSPREQELVTLFLKRLMI